MRGAPRELLTRRLHRVGERAKIAALRSGNLGLDGRPPCETVRVSESSEYLLVGPNLPNNVSPSCHASTKVQPMGDPVQLTKDLGCDFKRRIPIQRGSLDHRRAECSLRPD